MLFGSGLLLLILIYFKLAKKYNIVDIPSKRSSHDAPVIRGGGIIFVFASILYFIYKDFPFPYFFTGLFLVSIISFWDDLVKLPSLPRLGIQTISTLFLVFQLFGAGYSWIWWAIALIFIVGWVNMYNFMDGINGMLALYGLVLIATFHAVNISIQFVDGELLLLLLMATVIFTFFNMRKNAMCFAGDVGSISLAFLFVFLLGKLVLMSGAWEYVLFFLWFGMDSAITILFRIYKKENIFTPHRTHLYQYLANEMNIPHLFVSIFYAVAQILINVIVLFSLQNAQNNWMAIAIIPISLCTYLCLRVYVKNRILQFG